MKTARTIYCPQASDHGVLEEKPDGWSDRWMDFVNSLGVKCPSLDGPGRRWSADGKLR
jgi:hypothetical protein